MLLLLMACSGGDPSPTTLTGEGLFEEGCPDRGALARQIGVDASLPGEIAVGTRGDFLLANEHAAYVITEPDKGSTYWYYGGAVADAVAMEGCTPTGEDLLDEVGIVLGELEITDIPSSILRAFRAETVEVIDAGGPYRPAIVRATGTDDTHWLVEYTLIDSAPGRPVSQPYGLEVWIDYILHPDSPVLGVEINIRNPSDDELSLVAAALLSFGPGTDTHSFAADALSLGSFDFLTDIPWLVSASPDGSFAYGVEAGKLSYIGISGVDVVVDATHVIGNPIELDPGDEAMRRSYMSVGATGGPSATGPLAAINTEPIVDQPMTVEERTFRIHDGLGYPLDGVSVELEADAGDGWSVLDEDFSVDGNVRLIVPETTWSFRAVVKGSGRDEVIVGLDDLGDEMVLGPIGSLDFRIVDGQGDESPARLELDRDDGLHHTEWVVGEGSLPLEPGTWTIVSTRGYEFAPDTQTVVVPEDGAAELDVTLPQVIDSTGWLSVDTHVHTADSPDSDQPPADQLRRAAAHGLEVVVYTEHEHVVDRTDLVFEEGLDPWVATVTGEEVTASLPEHLTLFPVVPEGPRGGPVEWYGLSIADIFENMRERSPGGVSMVNHPSWLGSIEWDNVSASPGITDSTLFGLPAGEPLWDWNVDGLEVMNGHRSPFGGRFEYWQSMLNAGYPMVGTGCSDTHDGDDIGFPRSYFPASSDDTSVFDPAEVVDAYLAGQVVMSAGAFLEVSIDQGGPGTLISATDSVSLDVRIQAIEEADVSHFVVFADCDQVLSEWAQDPAAVLKYEGSVDVPVAGDTTIVVAVFGEDLLPTGLPQYDATRTPRAMSNAIYVDGDGDGVFTGGGGRVCSYDLEPPD